MVSSIRQLVALKRRFILRRLLLLLVILGLPVLAAAPVMAHTPAAKHVSRTPATKHGKKHHARKHAPKKQTKKPKKHAKTHSQKKKHRRAKKTPTPHLVATPVPPTSTPIPTDTPTPTSTPTSTPTDTPTSTPTPTVTPTPTPLPAIAGFQFVAGISHGYRVAFQVCGLPQDVTATFGPNPAPAVSDTTSSYGASARTNLSILAPWTVQPNQYLLAVHTYFEDASGNPVQSPLGGDTVSPRAVLLTIDGNGNATMQASTQIPAVGMQGCSTVPGTFQAPTPGPTAPPSISVSSSVSDPHPTAGEAVIVNGTFLVGGQPVTGILMRTNWYFPNGLVNSCYASTASNGTAACSVDNDNPVSGFVVQIQVTFDYQGQTYTSYSSYVM